MSNHEMKKIALGKCLGTCPGKCLGMFLAGLVGLIGLAGCSFIPNYERPAAPVAQNFLNQDPPVGESATQTADIDWHDFFQDARLKALIEIALRNNRDLRVAVLNIDQTRAILRIRQADELPTLDAGLTASRGPVAPTYAVSTSLLAGVVVPSYELDFFGRVRALSQAAQNQLLASEEARKTVQISLIASVANAWLNLLADQQLLSIASQTLETRKDTLKLTNLKFDNDSASALDVAQSRSLLEAAKVAMAQAQRQKALDENALVLLIGQPLPNELAADFGKEPGLSDQKFMPDLPAGLPSEVLTRRPDILAAELQLKSANANIGAARAALFPSFTLTGSFGVAAGDWSSLLNSNVSAWSISSQLLAPVFDSGRSQANVKVAEVNKEIAIAQYEKALQSGFREVADALASRASLLDQSSAQKAQLQAEEERWRLTDLRFGSGVASALEKLDADRSLFAARQASVSIEMQQKQNLVTLYKVLGGGWKN